MARPRILRRRPREARAGFLGRIPRQLAVIGNGARDGAHDVERVERRHAHARFGDVEPRIRQIQRARSRRQSTASAAGARRSCDRPDRPGRRRARAAARRAAADPRADAAARRARRGPGTKTTLNVRPRAWCGVPTNTRPYRRNGGSQSSTIRRSRSTSRTSSIDTGPTSAIGLQRRQRLEHAVGPPDRPLAPAAATRSSHSPHVARSGHAAMSSTMGSANSRRWRRFVRSRSNRRMRADSGSSRFSASMRSR